ncbi:histidine kinase [Carnobacterium divergens]|uniref:Glycoside hydrolase family 73 protein n=1 Tax=Carnobacterium divergens TaxID=2748 RepID=A0AAW8R769_CARDV|nr:glycoside hydrolase family 73 protein [Carnobacterium divergens]MDO0876026.1 glycoside hydrolase family 73 protein [Carnobacterium divergens]MDT1957193.1 glycoside hydrolase family 73 protein [Carnobacterium divergens]MDT1973163.1 glycoside hydrolase family 73 protein [Carnobacterium divergens]MDT1996283.1 glycoside hydrolase family 73 protein [Carnobacterium divergens]MDT2012227.1 glycoside hydrolase family 73 protein [Carnobacterium divergens]
MAPLSITKKKFLPIIFLVLSLLLCLSFVLNNTQKKEVPLTQHDYSTAYQQKFIDEIVLEAQALQQQTNLFASITIAQAILESDWGRSDLAVDSHNLFGIKGSFNDQSSTLPTDEFENGERITIEASFKKYDTIQESMVDHIDFLNGGTYEAVKTSTDYKEAAYALQNGGYATDPHYAEKLIELIEQFKLNKYDQQRSLS